MAKQISKECHDQSIVDFIVAQASSAQQACFAGCPSYSKPATYKSDPCWARCFFALVLGPEAGQGDIHGTGGLPNAVLKQAWETAFETEDPRQGGCPNLLDPSSVGGGGSKGGGVSGGACDSRLMESVCGHAKGAGVGNCLVCVMQHEQLAGCGDQGDSFCSAGH